MATSTPTETVPTTAAAAGIPGVGNTPSPSPEPASTSSAGTLDNGGSSSAQSSSSTSTSSSVSTSTDDLVRSSSVTHSTTSSLQESLIPTSSSIAPHASGGISEGGLAGAIVGSIAGTFLLTLLGAVLFFRRRRDRKSHAETNGGRPTKGVKGPGQIYAQPTHSSLSSAKNAAPPSQSVPVGALYLDLSSYVPQPPDDGATASRIQTLFDRASLHIDNYYAASPPRSRLSQGGVAPSSMEHYDSAYLPAQLAVMLSKPRAGRAVLKHVLVRALLQGIEPGRSTEGLLPTPYASGLSVNTNNGSPCLLSPRRPSSLETEAYWD